MILRFLTNPVALVAALVLALAAAPSAALAQQQQRQPQRAPAQQPRELPPAGTPFVVVDPNQVLNQSSAAQGLRSQIEKHRTAFQAELQKQENELRNADQDLARQRTILAPEAFAQRRRDLEKRINDASQAAQNRRREFDRAFAEATRKIEQAMVEVVIEIVQERNYQIVVSKAAVVIVQTSLDITPEVIRRLNRKLPSVNVSLSKN